jgi:hypothetical protein
MTTSSVIFENQHYAACTMRDGSLVITHKRKRGGKRLVGDQAPVWIEAIKTADDASSASSALHRTEH